MFMKHREYNIMRSYTNKWTQLSRMEDRKMYKNLSDKFGGIRSNGESDSENVETDVMVTDME